MAASLLALACTLPSVDVRAETVSFTTDNAVILNPERGLAKQMVVGDVSVAGLASLRADRHTLAWGLIKLFGEGERTNSRLSGARIDEIVRWMEALRKAKLKTILRIVYHEEQSFDPDGASLTIQRSHLAQLGEAVFKPYADVIVALQAGGIGAYGEWYYARPEQVTAESRKSLLDGMYDVIPDDMFVMVRTPWYRQEFEAAGGTADRVYRTAHYNDCFLSSVDDFGTYACYPESADCPGADALQSAVADDSSTVPVGGETCVANALNDCSATLVGMERLGYSFINTLYASYTDPASGVPGTIRDKWEAEGCFDTIASKLGYRYELVSAEVPDSVTPGETFSVTVTVRNTGWAPMYHARPVFLRMMDGSGGEVFFDTTGADPRDWLAGGVDQTFTVTSTAPATLDAGSVSLSLWMPDGVPANYRIPEYAVQFANQEVWDAGNGNNVLASGIPVVQP